MPYSRTTWVDYPNTTTPITAAGLNNIETGILALETGSVGVYTNEAARDAAITSPTEGMRAYLTAPTVPAATGAITAVPTGVQTIYNGSAWVCITPVGSTSNTSATTTSTSYVTTLTGDSTAISVTLVTGATALVSVYAANQSTNSGASTAIYVGTAVSGATTLPAFDLTGSVQVMSIANAPYSQSRTYVFPILTAGTNTFTLSYRGTAGTNTFTSRSLTVQGIA